MQEGIYPRAKKHLGQHFLIDHNIVRKIIAAANLESGQTVLEIGPGCGALTRLLCAAASKVVAVEIDSDLVTYLRQTHSDLPNLELCQLDALEFPFADLPSGTIVVANLPYQISTPLLFRFFEWRACISRMVLMLQWEVARRLVAKPGNREYGILSVLSQYFASPHIAFKIPRTCFRPRPDVDSAVVRFDMSSPRSLPQDAESALMHIVRVAFAHRRKILSNAFRDAGYTLSEIRQIFGPTGIDPQRRAETLSLEEFLRLTTAFQKTPLDRHPAEIPAGDRLPP